PGRWTGCARSRNRRNDNACCEHGRRSTHEHEKSLRPRLEPQALSYSSTPSRRRAVLDQNLDDHAAVLGAASLGLVVGGRVLLAVADRVHLVQRHLMLLVEITLHRFGTLKTQSLVPFS